MRFLRDLFMRHDEVDEKRDQAKTAEVDDLLVRSDEALAEKDRVVDAVRGVNRERADRVTAAYRYMDTRRARGKAK